jgi:tetratricopeptide (TPR) repeat protein
MEADDPAIVLDLGNLGLVQEELGQLAEARASFERALAICARAGPRADPEMVTILNMNLGRVLERVGQLAEARAAYERALAIAIVAFGEDHEVTATLRESMAELENDT